MKRQNKISFLKYLIIGIPVFAALGLVAFALREFGIDGHVSAAEFICFAVAAVMTDWLTKRIYSKKEISKKA
ncbi:MAG: hypothetical protein LBK26_00230 [Rickettsiales bacterium]|nr:hypothetical protein [Rickettsiales bacterium]